jgi:hypothetical protein
MVGAVARDARHALTCSLSSSRKLSAVVADRLADRHYGNLHGSNCLAGTAARLNLRSCSVEFVMRKSNWTPRSCPMTTIKEFTWCSMISAGLPRSGGRPTLRPPIWVTSALLNGEYKNPVRVIGFNTAERWSEDVSADVAQELRRRCDLQLRDIPFRCRNSSTATKDGIATNNCRCRCGWSDDGVPAQEAARKRR